MTGKQPQHMCVITAEFWYGLEAGLFDMALKNLGFLGFFLKKPKKSEFRFS